MKSQHRDRGVILPITLVIVVVLAVVVAAVATYASATLRYGQVVEQSAERLAAANAGMDSALEALGRNASLCALTTRANSVYETDDLPTINGITPSVRCRTIIDSGHGPVTGVEEFALILTGDRGTGSRDGPMLWVRPAPTTRKVIDGPVFMDLPPSTTNINLAAPLTIQNGDLWYRHPTLPCPTPGPVEPSGLLITPAGYDIRCAAATNWRDLFSSSKPPESAVIGLPDATPDPPFDPAGCKVFSPGRYSTRPVLGAYNYFESGDYHFDNIGEWEITDAYALFGWPGSTGPGIPGRGTDTIAANICVGAWEADSAGGGATIFLGGNSRIKVNGAGSLEVSGRDQGGRHVALMALEDAPRTSTVQGDDAGNLRLLKLGSGLNRQVSINGLVWAPFASVAIDGVSNAAVPVLRGGAVVGELHVGATADATNLLVSNGNTPAVRKLEFTSTAVSPNGGETQVRAIVTYRDGDYALESRRVMCITPDDPDPAAC